MTNWLADLSHAASKPERVVIGLMSGTSVNAIDVAICRIREGGPSARVELQHLSFHPFDTNLQATIRRPEQLTVQTLAEIHAQIGDAFGDAVLAALDLGGVTTAEVDLIGSHGQTVYHHSGRMGAIPCTLQVGDGDRIAERTGVPVFSDFRMRDIAAGGEGAPLSPYADLALYPSRESGRRVVLNLGGVANVTVLDEDPARIIGFDTGPANGPLDRLAARLSGGALACDEDGKMMRRGKIKHELLEQLLTEDAYLSRVPPKSTGFEMYGDQFVDRVIALHGGLDDDLLATVAEFVVVTIAQSIRRFVGDDVVEVIAAGGGTQNPYLIARLRERLLPIALVTSDERGVPSGGREAMAFALLANDALLGLATSIPAVTGARFPRTLGKLSLPNPPKSPR